MIDYGSGEVISSIEPERQTSYLSCVQVSLCLDDDQENDEDDHDGDVNHQESIKGNKLTIMACFKNQSGTLFSFFK